MTRRTSPARRPSARDPYGVAPATAALGPILALVGLVVVAVLSGGLLLGRLPLAGGGGPDDGNGGPGAIDATPAPSNVVVVPDDPRADVPGTIAYAKQGSIWLQSGTTARQLTAGADDSMPAWTSDGRWVYFVRTVTERVLWPSGGSPRYYTATYPLLMRVDPDGGEPEQVATGKYKAGKYTWFYWIRQPTPNPIDPDRLALVSDQPDPTKSNVVLQLYDVTTKKWTRASGAKEVPPLGHQDPAWHPAGKLLLYVMNDRDGRRGAPAIFRYDPTTNKPARLTGPGFTGPSYSPDGKLVAATKTTPFGTDVVVLDAVTGGEVLRVTDDGSSWSPAWSPRGDAIAFLHVTGRIADLRMATLTGSGASLAVDETIDLTSVSGLDGTSRPSWYIPASELPPPSPSPSPSPPPAASPSPSPAG
jgi:Tol biopolymer transport system component